MSLPLRYKLSKANNADSEKEDQDELMNELAFQCKLPSVNMKKS